MKKISQILSITPLFKGLAEPQLDDRELLEKPKIADNAYIDWLKKETFGY